MFLTHAGQASGAGPGTVETTPGETFLSLRWHSPNFSMCWYKGIKAAGCSIAHLQSSCSGSPCRKIRSSRPAEQLSGTLSQNLKKLKKRQEKAARHWGLNSGPSASIPHPETGWGPKGVPDPDFLGRHWDELCARRLTKHAREGSQPTPGWGRSTSHWSFSIRKVGSWAPRQGPGLSQVTAGGQGEHSLGPE